MVFFYWIKKEVYVAIEMPFRLFVMLIMENESEFNQNIFLEGSRHSLLVFNESGVFFSSLNEREWKSIC